MILLVVLCVFRSIDPSEALALRGVVRFVSHSDVPGTNGQILNPKEEVIFSTTVSNQVQSFTVHFVSELQNHTL